jgi:hypothetical protein
MTSLLVLNIEHLFTIEGKKEQLQKIGCSENSDADSQKWPAKQF